MRARALLQRGQTGRAIPILQQILAVAPEDAQALQQLAAIHHARGEFVLAEQLARRLVKAPDGEIAGQSLLGTIHHDLARQRRWKHPQPRSRPS